MSALFATLCGWSLDCISREQYAFSRWCFRTEKGGCHSPRRWFYEHPPSRPLVSSRSEPQQEGRVAVHWPAKMCLEPYPLSAYVGQCGSMLFIHNRCPLHCAHYMRLHGSRALSLFTTGDYVEGGRAAGEFTTGSTRSPRCLFSRAKCIAYASGHLCAQVRLAS